MRLFRGLVLCSLFLSTFAFSQDDRLVLVGASYGKNVLAICDSKGEILWKHDTAGPEKGHTGHHDVHLMDNGNILFHDTWTRTQEITLGKEVVWDYESKPPMEMTVKASMSMRLLDWRMARL